MSSLWTPGGERPVPRRPEPGGAEAAPTAPPGPASSAADSFGGGAGGLAGGPEGPDEAELQQQVAELREQLARTPAEVVVANHAYGLFELAALHLSLDPPQLDQARVAIDALGYLVEGLGERLGQPGADLQAGLAQLRMAYVQVQAAVRSGAGGDSPG